MSFFISLSFFSSNILKAKQKVQEIALGKLPLTYQLHL